MKVFSKYTFRIMGKENSNKMLKEGFKANAFEALEMGLISEVVPHEKLLSRAQVEEQLILTQTFLINHDRSWERSG